MRVIEIFLGWKPGPKGIKAVRPKNRYYHIRIFFFFSKKNKENLNWQLKIQKRMEVELTYVLNQIDMPYAPTQDPSCPWPEEPWTNLNNITKI